MEQAIASKPKKSFAGAVFAGTFGNILEWFDYGLYGYFATVFAAEFFVTEDPAVALILSMLTFAIGFLARPIGGLIVGAYSDKHGRVNAMTICIIGMGICTFLIGCLPNYATIGLAAPLLLAVLRICQGLLAGGGFGSSLTFLAEYGTPTNKAFISSWQPFSVGVGLLLGSLSGLLVTSLCTEEFLYAWGWRIPFWVGIVIIFYAFYVRKTVDETPEFKETQQEKGESISAASNTAELFKKHWYAMLTVLLLLVGASVTYYLLITYIPTYLSEFVGGSLSNSFLTNTIATALYSVFVPLSGILIDKIGPGRTAIIAPIGYILLTVPVYTFLTTMADSLPIAIGAILCLGVFQAILAVSIVVISAEVFPSALRNSGVGFAYNLAVAIFGGMGPTAATALITGTGDVMSITWLIMGTMAVTLLAAIFMLRRFYKKGRRVE